jgi:non-homologous end joining protein Ku
VEEAAGEKARGKPIRYERPAASQGTVVDLMDALQKSLSRKTARTAGRQAVPRGARKSAASARLKAS